MNEPTTRATVLTLHAQGWSQRAIARHVGVSQARMWKILQKAPQAARDTPRADAREHASSTPWTPPADIPQPDTPQGDLSARASGVAVAPEVCRRHPCTKDADSPSPRALRAHAVVASVAECA